MHVPDFFIAGAPKCGTTSLYRYLADHPGVAMSPRKEPAFWSPDVPSGAPVTDPRDYDALWKDAPDGALRGEASPHYLRSDVAVPAILRARPDARFVVLLRRPADLAAALHSEHVKSRVEDVGSFERAWRLQPARRRGERVPRACRKPVTLDYERTAAVGDQLERFVSWVPEGRRLVLLLDDLHREPRATYLRVLDFLGLPDDGRRDFPRHNTNVNVRSPRVERAHRSLPRRLGPLYAPLRAVTTRAGVHPLRTAARLNVVDAERPALSPALEAELRDAFAGQVDKLEAILGRDLTHWR